MNKSSAWWVQQNRRKINITARKLQTLVDNGPNLVKFNQQKQKLTAVLKVYFFIIEIGQKAFVLNLKEWQRIC